MPNGYTWHGPDLTADRYLTATQQSPMIKGDPLATGKKKKDEKLLALLMELMLFSNPLAPAPRDNTPTPTPVPSPTPTKKPLYRDDALQQADDIYRS